MTLIAKKSVRDQVYDVIKQKIFNQEYQLGDTINITSLCKELGVSNTPIREALARLEAEGLVTTTMSSKVNVINLDEKIFTDISTFFCSQILGAFSLCRIMGKTSLLIRMLEDALESQKAALNEENEYLFAFKAIEFDRTFVAATENETMLKIYDSQSSLLYLQTLHTYHKDAEIRRENLEQHRAILEAVKMGNVEDAMKKIYHHFDKHF